MYLNEDPETCFLDDMASGSAMNERPTKIVDCPIHGESEPAFVCRHLNLDHPVGFVEGYDPDDPDTELFHAWCSECDIVLQREGTWNDRSETFAGVRMVCRGCYQAMKAKNPSR
jgi:hypothetical protein